MGDRPPNVWYWIIGGAAVVAVVGLKVFEPGTPQVAPRECEIQGRVFGAVGTPLEAFEITVRHEDGRVQRIPFSQAKGLFAFTLAPGRYRISCSAGGHRTTEEKVTVSARSERIWLQFTVRK